MIKTFKQYPNLEFIDLPQRSPEWHTERFGSIGGSEFETAVAKGRGKTPSKTRGKLLEEKAVEQYTGEPTHQSVQTRAMRLGTALEPIARGLLKSKTGLLCAETGIARNKLYPGFHLSPDGVDFDNVDIIGTEIKCPTAKVHAGYLTKAINPGWMRPVAYRHQINHYFVILGAAMVIFFSYCSKERALEELPSTPGFEWFDMDSEWSEYILRFIPRPSAAEMNEHESGMRTWRIDYKQIFLKADQLVVNRQRAQEQKESEITNAALRVTELNKSFLEKIR